MAAALKNHELAEISVPGVKVEKRPARGPDGKVAAGLTTPGSGWTTRSSSTPTPPTW